MSYSASTKSTSNAPVNNENPGTVTSDSLAAESINSGGSFAANSDSRGPMDQPSRSTNTNNTDTSGATTLSPAPDAEARDAQEGWSETGALNAASSGSGIGSDDYSSGGAQSQGQRGGSGSSSTGSYASVAGGQSSSSGGPSYATEPSLDDSNAPNSSFSTDIGGKNDPGRAALEDMQAGNSSAAGGAGGRQEQVSGDGQYDTLGDTSA